MGELEGINKNVTILVVDDYTLTREMVRSILKQLGFVNIICVESGHLALEELRTRRIDVIICDWNMPGMSGLELLKQIRSAERYIKLPFLMLTAEAYRENILEATKAGVTDYIAKPFTAQTLGEKLEKIFKPAEK